jgi:triosephosphate isomerase (TIM)
MSRRFIVAANWKMNKSPDEAVTYLQSFLKSYAEQAGNGEREVVFFVPAIDLWVTKTTLQNSAIRWGAQNCYFEKKGAFTGENSPEVLASIGASYVLVGHSERRALFHESDTDTGNKVKILQQLGMTPMLCVGESLADREAGKTNEVILRQLRTGLQGFDEKRSLVIAYEPVWAIGTGKVATPEQANDAHQVLRKGLSEIGGEKFASSISILYGGSVKADNAKELASQPEIDGFLVGGASLEVASFLPLCLYGTNSK